jgi:MOSC domain-containing protein YiiM
MSSVVQSGVVGYVQHVLRGRVAPLGERGVPSGIDKAVIVDPVQVLKHGLEGDEQGDTRAHGGPDKAVHCYSADRYPGWLQTFPDNPLFTRIGAFGENFSVTGINEASVCMGDIWQVGTARFQVSQGRQPCFKLNLRFGIPDMARRVQDTLWAGWYLRVLEPGQVRGGDAIYLLERPYPDFPVAHVLALIRDRVTDVAVLEGVLRLPLPDSWRNLFQRRLQSQHVEDWSRRLHGDNAPGQGAA